MAKEQLTDFQLWEKKQTKINTIYTVLLTFAMLGSWVRPVFEYDKRVSALEAYNIDVTQTASDKNNKDHEYIKVELKETREQMQQINKQMGYVLGRLGIGEDPASKSETSCGSYISKKDRMEIDKDTVIK